MSKVTVFRLDRNSGHQATGIARRGDRRKAPHDVELTVAEGLSREQLLLALDKLKMRILEIRWPPA